MIDLHCDTILLLDKSGDRATLDKNPFSVDVKKLQANQSKAQFFALFTDTKETDNPWANYQRLHQRFTKEIERCDDVISWVKSFSAYQNSDKIAAFLTVEGGGVLEGQLSRLEKIYNQGVRLLTLTWNYENALGFPNTKKYQKNGLKVFGKEVIEWMNHAGMIIDVSHLSDAGFYDVAEQSKDPFVASHSNARSICSHPRNLSDQMLRTIGNTGSIVGVNFYPQFLNGTNQSNLEDIVNHIDYLCNKAGTQGVAIGTDFDGITGQLAIENISEMNRLYEALEKKGYTTRALEKIWYKNAERIIKTVL